MCNVKCKAHKLQVGTMSIMVAKVEIIRHTGWSWVGSGSLSGKWVGGRDEDILFIK